MANELLESFFLDKIEYFNVFSACVSNLTLVYPTMVYEAHVLFDANLRNRVLSAEQMNIP